MTDVMPEQLVDLDEVGGGEPVTPPTDGLDAALLTFLWVPFHDRPGSGGQRPPRVRSAMAISASGLW